LTESAKLANSPEPISREKTSFDWWATARLLFFVVIGVFLLLLATTPGPLCSGYVLRTLLTTFVYTFCIGTIALYIINRVIDPVKFQSEAVVWSLVILCSLGMAVIGAAAAETLLLITGLFPGQTFSGRFTSGLKISLIVSLAVALGTHTYNRMRKRLHSQNLELQKKIETDVVRSRQQDEDVQKAREIQQGLLPKNVPQIVGYQVTGTWQPALSVGGDYYDVLPLRDSSLGAVIADVSERAPVPHS